MVEGGLDDGVYDTLQLPADSTHVAELNVPPAPLSLNVTLPVGAVGEDEVSVTVTVKLTDVPGLAVPVLGETVKEVGSETDVLLLLVNIKVPLSAIAGMVKLPENNEQNTHAMSENKAK